MIYSLSGFLFEEKRKRQSPSFEEFCSLAARLGYSGVELRRTQINPDTPKDVRKRMLDTVRSKRLIVTCLTTRNMPPDGSERDAFLLSYLDLCADMRCRLLKTSGEPAWMSWAAQRAAPIGITLARNNHVGTDLETVQGTERFLEAVGEPNVRLLYDPRHLYAGGEDYVGAVRRLAPSIVNVLVQSVRPTRTGVEASQDDMVSCMPDDPDAQDWSGIFGELKAVGYNGLVTVIENGWPAEEREHVAKHNIDFLRRQE